MYIYDDISGAGDGDKVLEFYAETAGGNVWFNLSGFTDGRSYTVNRSGTTISTPTADGSGYISFSNDVWSEHLFEIFQQTGEVENNQYGVNNDGKVNFQDAGLVWIHRTSEVDYDEIYDVNQDGVVNFQDAGLVWINRD